VDYGRIIAAAIYMNGIIFWVPAPGRHNHVFALMRQYGLSQPYNEEQGFLTSTGWFIRRKPAVHLAIKEGQIIAPKWGDQLYSEDLW
jgi:hypothetical protein